MDVINCKMFESNDFKTKKDGIEGSRRTMAYTTNAKQKSVILNLTQLFCLGYSDEYFNVSNGF